MPEHTNQKSAQIIKLNQREQREELGIPFEELMIQLKNRFGVTQVELAHYLGMSQSSISDYKKGHRKLPPAEAIPLIDKLIEIVRQSSESPPAKQPKLRTKLRKLLADASAVKSPRPVQAALSRQEVAEGFLTVWSLLPASAQRDMVDAITEVCSRYGAAARDFQQIHRLAFNRNAPDFLLDCGDPNSEVGRVLDRALGAHARG